MDSNENKTWNPTESAVPSSSFARMSEYASLGVKLISGTIIESAKQKINLS